MKMLKQPRHLCVLAGNISLMLLITLLGTRSGFAQNGSAFFTPGNLVVSRSIYDNNRNNVTADVTLLPPNCAVADSCATATNDGSYPYVFNNDLVDSSFGITSKILLDQTNPADGSVTNTLEVPNSSQNGVPLTKDQLVTSFPSKSELALNLSTDHNFLTFMGYVAPIDLLDVSNSNTPTIPDATNPVGEYFYRAIAQVDAHGKFHFTLTNAYSGNNGRAAILAMTPGGYAIYTSGNAGNGGKPQPDGIIIGGGAQIMTPEVRAEVAQNPGEPTPVGSFDISQLGAGHDKIGKDDNFRGLTIFNNVVYFTKGSGSNGANTVYFVDTTGLACPTGGVGLPQAGALLPDAPLPYDPLLLQTDGLVPYNMCILKGFAAVPNSALKKKTTAYPFGLWFADANTVYVADEGDGAAADVLATQAGLQKWVFDSTTQMWKLAYTLQNGLQLGTTYTIDGYPTGNNPATGLPWAPATDGLRNITGRVNGDGTATIWGITSTISGSGDQGADPNRLVSITDTLSATTLPAAETFTTLRTAGYGEVLRGVAFTPGTGE